MRAYLYLLLVLTIQTTSCKSQENKEPMPEDVSVIFDETPSHLTCSTSIAGLNEPGERIRISGIVYEPDGRTPAKNVVLYFYHTNDKGIYAKSGKEPRSSMSWWHGYNRGWIKTNEKGEYVITSIKPKPYPSQSEPAHIHVVVNSPSQRQPYDLGAITFKGDPLATEKYWYQVEQHGHPRDGGTELRKNDNNILEGRRNFTLYAQYDNSPLHSGLNAGDECPTFTPVHFTGPDKGTKVCPMCKYGYRKGVMAWINFDDIKVINELAHSFEREAVSYAAKEFKGFIIFMNPAGLSNEEIESKIVANYKSKSVAFLTIPASEAEAVYNRYRLNRHPEVKSTVIYFERRLVTKKTVHRSFKL